ncbi:MAG: L-2-hydroxyglutarate oxidase [Ignavibacteria bacterium]|nr:L-2-hydroxyglutarate oxidase [Ignavibacteria bacterium]
MKQFDVVVVGAGIVGLATALKLLKNKSSLKVAIIEKENDVAKHQTGNNSGVIHSGIYYKPGSLKAKNCVDGYNQLIKFCREENIKFELCGKIIIAVNEKEIPTLNMIYDRGIQNGLSDLKIISQEQIKEYEPHARGLKAIHVPQAGIIDFKEVAKKYTSVIEKNGGEIFYSHKLLNLKSIKSDIISETTKGEFISKYFVSCAGLFSDRVAKLTNKHLPIRIIPFRGEYYKLKENKKYLVKNLIYPVPDPAFPFLGVHFTRMIDGGVEAGPNAVLSFKREGYKKNSFNMLDTLETFSWKGFHKVVSKYWRVGVGEFYRSYNKKAFVKALGKLVPEINGDDLIAGGAGVRAQACDLQGGLLDDFNIQDSGNIIHVCNAPSPAATASLSIGDHIANLILKKMS